MRIIDDLLTPLKLGIKKYSSDLSVKQARYVADIMWKWGNRTNNYVAQNLRDNGYTDNCAERCDYCCFQNVRINIFEAIAISQWIRNNLSEKVKNKIIKNAEFIFKHSSNDKYDSDRWIRRQPCLCLDKKSKMCLIYEVRPLECRLAISHDKFSCQNNFNDNTSKSISVSPPSGVEFYLPKETRHMNVINNLADYVTITLVECISDYLMNSICSKNEISGNFIYPKTKNLLISLTDMELNRTLRFTLNGDMNLKLKSLVRLKSEGIYECTKITDIVS